MTDAFILRQFPLSYTLAGKSFSLQHHTDENRSLYLIICNLIQFVPLSYHVFAYLSNIFSKKKEFSTFV